MITLFLTAITVGMALYISADQSEKMNTTFQRVSHTQEVLFQAEKLLAALTERETLTREYALTGDEGYLRLLEESGQSVNHEFSRLKAYTVDNDNQQQRLDSLGKYIRLGAAVSDSLVVLVRAGGRAAGARLLATEEVKNVGSMIRQLIVNVEDHEQKLLKDRRTANISAMSNLRAVLYVGISLLVILVMVLIQKLRVEVIADKETYDVMQYNATLMNNIRDAIVSTDKDFIIVSWNKQAEIIFGWTEREMKGKTFASMMSPSYKGSSRASVIKELIKTGTWSGEASMEKKNGDIITILLSSSLIRNSYGKITGTVAIARDITSRKQVEEQLKMFNEELGKQVEERRSELNEVIEQLVLSEKKYKLLFANNPLPMMMVTLPEMGITDVNDAAIEQYGYPKEVFVEKTIYDLLAADGESYSLLLTEESLGYHYGGECKHKKEDGSLIYVELFTHGMIFEGRQTKLILAHDITQKVEADNKLKQYLEEIRMLTGHLLEIREEERKNIAREIHDELGQQLTVLKMEVAWAIRKLNQPGKREVKLEGLLETIDGTMRSVRRICSELRPTLLDDLGLVAALQWHAGQLQSSTGINIDINAPEEISNLTPEIKTGMYRIFQESLTNVVRHADAKKVDVCLAVADKMIILHIKDDGKGFDISASSQKRTLGILGMKERSLGMGGEYIIESYPGRGTSVMVTIPVEAGAENLTTKTSTNDKDPYSR